MLGNFSSQPPKPTITITCHCMLKEHRIRGEWVILSAVTRQYKWDPPRHLQAPPRHHPGCSAGIPRHCSGARRPSVSQPGRVMSPGCAACRHLQILRQCHLDCSLARALSKRCPTIIKHGICMSWGQGFAPTCASKSIGGFIN